MPNHKNVQFDIAEVLTTATAYTYTVNKADMGLYKFRVRSCTQHTKIKEYDVTPLDLHNIKLPVIGEIILVCKTINRTRQRRNDNERESWYYISTLNIQSGINNNVALGMSFNQTELNSINTQEYPIGSTFNEKFVTSPLQLFEGDYVWQGRFGQSIRFGSTISTMPNEYYYKSPNWLGDNNGDPITIIANGQQNKPQKEFVVEDINTDNSSIYLTSTQKIPIVLGSESEPNPLYGCVSTSGNESSYIGSQLLGVSDRIILKARTDLAIIDSPMGIILNSTGAIKLGSEEASESMVHGEVLLEVLQSILNQLRTVVQCGSASGTFINLTYADKAQKQLQELLS